MRAAKTAQPVKVREKGVRHARERANIVLNVALRESVAIVMVQEYVRDVRARRVKNAASADIVMVNAGCVMELKSLMALHAKLVAVLGYVTSVMEIGGRHVPLAMGTATVINAEATRYARRVKALPHARPAVVTDIVRRVLTATANVRTVQALAR